MATNISVTLTIDNQTYIANLNKAKSATKDFANDAKSSADSTTASFNRMNSVTGALHGNLGRLKGALAGAAFAGFAKSAMAFADQVQDLSNVIGIATPAIVNFQKAVGSSGGTFEKGARGLLEFYQNIAEARNGSVAAQAAFAELGISLDDLGTLDEAGILDKTLKALSEMDASGEKVRLQSELMGRAMKGISIDPQFLAILKQGDADSQKLAASIENAARLNDRFNESWITLKLTFLEAFTPMIEGLAAIINFFEELNKKLPILTGLFKLLGAVIVGFMVASGFRAIISGISFVAKGLDLILKGFRALKGIKVGGELAAGADKLTKAARTRNAAGQFTKKETNPLLMPQNTVEAQAFRNKASAVGFAAGAVGFGAASLLGGDQSKPAATLPKASTPAIDALATFKSGLDDVVESYANMNKKQLETLRLENSLIGVSKTDAEIKKAMIDLDQKEANELQKLESQRKKLTTDQKKLGAEAAIDLRIAKLKEQTAADKASMEDEIKNTAKREIANSLLTSSRQKLYAIQQQINDLKFDTTTMGMSQLDKTLANIVKSSDDWVKSTIEGLANAQNISADAFKELYPDKVTEVYAAAAQGLSKLTEEAKRNFAEAQKINDLNFKVQERIGYEKELTQIYNEQAKLGLGTLEGKYYDIEAAARASAQAQIDSIDKVTFSAEQLANGMSIRQTDPARVKQIIDDANQGTAKLKTQTKNLYDTSRLFSTGWTRAFLAYKEAATDAAKKAEDVFTTATKNMEEAIVSFAKTGKFEWKSFVSSIVEELLRQQVRELIAKTFGGIGAGAQNQNSSGGGLLGLGGLFGFLADGGAAKAGRPYIVGERGPELFVPGTSGTVIPNNQMGGMGMSNVVYNINAVDAMSFKQMVARDPSFIYAVSQQGAKSIPSTRR